MARLALIFEAIDEERLERNINRRQKRTTFLERSIPDFEFVVRYRLSRDLFEDLCLDVVPLLPLPKNSRAIDPRTKILTALNYYARGRHQGAVAQNTDAPMVQQSVSNCIKEVTEALNTPHILSKYIKFPQTRKDRNALKRNFAARYGIPGVIGCIGCTHVAIVRPASNKERYLNQKNYHSLNVQIIADSSLKILNVDASHGGATENAFIWQDHEIKEHLENIQDEIVYLLGDSGYPLRQYLLTPIENAVEDSPEGHYNVLHKRTRKEIDRVFGVLKSRWTCLLAAKEMHYAPHTASKITLACVVLHNMCVDRGLNAPILSPEDINKELSRQPLLMPSRQSTTAALNQGRRARDNLIQLLEQTRSRSPN